MATYTQVKMIEGSVLTSTAAVYFTASGSTLGTKISSMEVYNSDTSPRTVTIYLATSASAPVLADTLCVLQLMPGESKKVTAAINELISPNHTIQAKADASGVVVIKASGVTITN